MSTIEPTTLLPSDRMQSQALSGDVTQIHRGQQYAEEGDTFDIEGTTFEVVEVSERTLGDMTDEDARAEGAKDVEHYKQILERVHDNFEWDDDSAIVMHRFEQQ
jgi:hypothetical protein